MFGTSLKGKPVDCVVGGSRMPLGAVIDIADTKCIKRCVSQGHLAKPKRGTAGRTLLANDITKSGHIT